MASCKAQSIYPHGKYDGIHSIAGWVVPRPSLEVLETSKIFVLARIRTPDHPVHSLILIWTTLQCLWKHDHTQHIIFLTYFIYSKFCSFSDSKNFNSVISYLKVVVIFKFTKLSIFIATQHILQNPVLLCIIYLTHNHTCHIKMQYQIKIKQVPSNFEFHFTEREL